MMPLHPPPPLFKESRPPPLARVAPMLTLTATAPARLTRPLTLPPPAENTLPPATLKGTL
jgi:hypothetical protein